MIKSFRDKATETLATGQRVRAFQGFLDQAIRRLAVLNSATSLDDLRVLRSNRLEALSGNRDGQFSIRINMQWRVCFRWPEGENGPSDVEIVDYH